MCRNLEALVMLLILVKRHAFMLRVVYDTTFLLSRTSRSRTSQRVQHVVTDTRNDGYTVTLRYNITRALQCSVIRPYMTSIW